MDYINRYDLIMKGKSKLMPNGTVVKSKEDDNDDDSSDDNDDDSCVTV